MLLDFFQYYCPSEDQSNTEDNFSRNEILQYLSYHEKKTYQEMFPHLNIRSNGGSDSDEVESPTSSVFNEYPSFDEVVRFVGTLLNVSLFILRLTRQF